MPRHAKVLLTIVSVLTCCAARSEVDTIAGGYIISKAERTAVGATKLNPDYFLRIPDSSALVAVGLDGSALGMRYRVRLEKSYSDANGFSENAGKTTLQELAYTFRYDHDTSLIAGKRIISWDPGYSSTPLGFFQKEPDLTDILDTEGKAEGLPLLALALLRGNSDLTFVYSNDFGTVPDGFNRGLKQVALNWRITAESGTYSLVLQKPSRQSLGVGGAMFTQLSDNMTGHISFFARRGTSVPISRIVADHRSTMSVSDSVGPYRATNDQIFSHVVAGFTVATSGGINLLVEVSHDDRGLSRSQWNRWKDLVDFHKNQSNYLSFTEGEAEQIRRWQLANDSLALSTKGARRDYALVRVSKDVGRINFSALSRVNLSDRSALTNLSMNVAASRSLDLNLAVSVFSGAAGSEHSYLPIKRSLDALLKYSF